MDVVETIISSLWIILSLLLIFLLPGYIILYALYPKKDELGGITRIAIGFTLSIAVVMISNLTLDLIFGINTTPGSILVLTLLITILFLVIWMIRIWFSKKSQEKPIKKLII